jgi:hypothetical protein
MFRALKTLQKHKGQELEAPGLYVFPGVFYLSEIALSGSAVISITRLVV